MDYSSFFIGVVAGVWFFVVVPWLIGRAANRLGRGVNDEY
jgi:hypothetical protein